MLVILFNKYELLQDVHVVADLERMGAKTWQHAQVRSSSYHFPISIT
jgi:hypothetical protein